MIKCWLLLLYMDFVDITSHITCQNMLTQRQSLICMWYVNSYYTIQLWWAVTNSWVGKRIPTERCHSSLSSMQCDADMFLIPAAHNIYFLCSYSIWFMLYMGLMKLILFVCTHQNFRYLGQVLEYNFPSFLPTIFKKKSTQNILLKMCCSSDKYLNLFGMIQRR